MKPAVWKRRNAKSHPSLPNGESLPSSKPAHFYDTMEYEVCPTPQARVRDERDRQRLSGSYCTSQATQYEVEGPQAHDPWSQSMSIHSQHQTTLSREEDGSKVWRDPAQLEPTAGPYLQDEDDKAVLAAVQRFAQAAAPPPYEILFPLNKPVAIPQLTQSKTTNFMAPPGSGASGYARIYSPTLMQHGISEAEFLTFIDGLNVVCTTSQKLQALSLANTVLGFDPTGSAQIISMAAGVGMQAMQQKIFDRRAAVYLDRANTDFFRPRGLRIQKCSLDELRRIAQIPANAPLRIPLDATSICASVAENLARALQPWLAPLKFDMLPIATPGSANTLQKLNNFQAKHLNKQLERDLIGHRLKELSRNPESLNSEEVSSIAASVRASGGRTMGWQAKRFEKKMAKNAERSRSREPRVDKKEEKAVLRTNFLVITPLIGR
ncbi:hypothetical protein H2200_004983 [Cladophialophora chaetospira]|uniref:Uncharacterized protein n=1 Tax=Cladophialophora chaetospira TaxID=386627 RepID=A0AA38XBA9_9EURO|nr:hypothetical protein H2200_004983 [Cladophialophora chaetospira]